MATYGLNILPVDASRYTLHNATLANGLLSIRPGGYAHCALNKNDIASLTEWFRVSMVTSTPVDRYEPWLFMHIRAKSVDGMHYNFSCAPTQFLNNVYNAEIQLASVDYEELSVTIRSTVATSLSLWELCPEALETDVYLAIDGVERAVPNLLADYNLEPLAIEQAETVVGSISYGLSKEADIQGHLKISYVASSDCVLTIRVKDTGITELYTPISYDIAAGRGSVALPHAYLNRSAGQHHAYVTAQVSTGQLTVVTRGLLYTIDGSYMATRTIDAGVEVQDFTVRQLPGEKSPSELWAISVDAGECVVRSRDYDVESVYSFVPKYTLGRATAAAIEFNGQFTVKDDGDNVGYTLATDEFPYAFWIDNIGQLWCQYGSDTSTRTPLDTSVSVVRACRGFNSAQIAEQDQGLIVLYIKNGVATYKNYCYTSSGYTWQGPFTIPVDVNVIDVSIHRLNDYRVGFIITTNSNNYWFISSRTYVNQAAAPDIIRVGYEATPYIALMPSNVDDSITAVTELDAERTSVLIMLSHVIKLVDDTRPLVPSNFISDGPAISSVSVVASNAIQLVFATRVTGDCTVTYAPSGDIKLTYEPVAGATKALLNFVAHVTLVPITYSYAESLGVEYSATGDILLRGKGEYANQSSEVLSVDYAASASIDYNKVEYADTATAEQLSVNYAAYGSIILTQTGSKPI